MELWQPTGNSEGWGVHIMVPGKARGKGAIYTVRRHGRVQRSSTKEAETLALVQGRRRGGGWSCKKAEAHGKDPDSFQGKRSSEQDLKQVSGLCRKPKDSPKQTYPRIHQSCSCSPISGICYHPPRRPLCLRVWPGCVWPNLGLPQWGWGVTLHGTKISAIPQWPQITAFSGLFMWIKILSGKLYMQFSAIKEDGK